MMNVLRVWFQRGVRESERIACVSVLLWMASCSARTEATQPVTSQQVANPVPVSMAHEEKKAGLQRAFSKPVALMPQAVTSFGAALQGNRLYVLGGYFGIAHQYSRVGQSSAFQRLNLGTGEWETLPSRGALQSATLSEFEGKLYRVGGLRIHNDEGTPANLESLAAVERFDPQTSTWTALTPLPMPRSSHGAVVAGNELFVVGGWRLQGDRDSGSWDDVVYVADLTKEPLEWRALEIPFRLRALGAAALDGKLITVGGIDENGASSEVHVFEVKSRSWSRGPDYPEPGFGVSATTLNGTVFASGVSGTVYSLNLAEHAWNAVTTLSFPRAFHQLLAGEDRLIAVGGIAGMRRVDRVRHVELVTFGAPPEPFTHWEIGAPGPAKNRQGAFLSREQLYVFGGNNSMGQHDFSAENFLSESHQLDLGSFRWKPAPLFPEPRQSMQTVVTSSGSGFSVGGFGFKDGNLTTADEVYRFDFEAKSWAKAERGLAASRTQFGLAEHDGALWIFGGLNFDDARKGAEKFVHPTEVLKLDIANPDAGFVGTGSNIPRPRRAFAGALLDNRYYLVGGMAQGFKPVEECDVFDFKTKTWSSCPKPNRTRVGAEMVALNGKLYLIAGRSLGGGKKLGPDKSVEVFDPDVGGWSLWSNELPMEDTHHLRLFTFGQRLVVYSAQRSDAKVDILLIDPAAVAEKESIHGKH